MKKLMSLITTSPLLEIGGSGWLAVAEDEDLFPNYCSTSPKDAGDSSSNETEKSNDPSWLPEVRDNLDPETEGHIELMFLEPTQKVSNPSSEMFPNV